VRWKSPPPSIDTLRLLQTFGRYFATLLINDDEMQPRGFEKGCELADDLCVTWSGFCLRYDVVRQSCPYRELALAQVGKCPRGPNISICWKIAHKASVAY
jgi:hypothetical protein